MQGQLVTYYKRYKMEIELGSFTRPSWPDEIRCLPWKNELIESHAEALIDSFHGEMDSLLFPNLGNAIGCHCLIEEIANRKGFLPEGTWLLQASSSPCGTIQTLQERGACGAIQNVGISPSYRGRGLGKLLVSQALWGMQTAGLGKAVLEVTSGNFSAMQLYLSLGFRKTKVLYKSVPVGLAETVSLSRQDYVL